MKHMPAVFAVLGFLICASSLRAEEGLKAGVQAPVFTLPAVGTAKSVSLRSYADKSVVILHFWKSK